MGMIFRVPAFLILLVVGLWGLFQCFHIIQDDFGTFAAVICLILAPPVLALIPWYEGIVNGDWHFLRVLYGAAISAGVLMYIGGLIDKASGKSKKASGKDGKDVEDEDKQNGLMTHRYERGEKKLEGYYKDGELDGLWTEWYLTGEIKSKTFYENGKEYGASTGRPRRCGWFDAVAVKYAVQVNGIEGLALTKLDVLDDEEEIKICTGYRCGDNVLKTPPADIGQLGRCEPEYEVLPGWAGDGNCSGVHRESDLPSAARAYIERLEELSGVSAAIITLL